MKNVSKILSLVLAAATLFLAGCTKKPNRNGQLAAQTGPDNTINPETLAVPGDVPPGLETRGSSTGAPTGESVVSPIYFALDRFAVAPAERPKLTEVKKWLTDNPDKNLVLVGQCDWRGTAEYNLGLGDRRANAVKKYLESMGVDSRRLETLSKGSTGAKQGGGESEWQKDRRVDFVELRK